MPLPKLIVADSDRDPDMLYATGFFVPDPFIFLQQRGRSTIVLSDLEIDRGRKEARADKIVPLSELSKLCKRGKDATFADHIAAFLLQRKIRKASVPRTFPLGIASDLAARGIKVEACDGLFFPEREHKRADELKHLRRALKITQIGIARGFEVLRASEPGKKKVLRWGGSVLTSEVLRAEIDSAILRAGGVPANTIVAGGEQACDPHERGSGPLRADELIILDVFPRDAATGFFGDMTRTVVRGRASEAQRKLWHTVLQAQQNSIAAMKPRADGKALQDSVRQFFTDQGYPTEQRDGRWCGFFHGLGHGLGLEIHEEPRIARTKFQPGQVLTVEPGLYYPGVGGARHEDVVVITAKGNDLLSKFQRPFEL